MNRPVSETHTPINIRRELEKVYLEFKISLLNLYKKTKDKDYLKMIKELKDPRITKENKREKEKGEEKDLNKDLTQVSLLKDMGTIIIKNGWYKIAGVPAKYNWAKDGHDIRGVGIAASIIDESRGRTIKLRVEDNDYDLKVNQALFDLIAKYKAYHKAKHEVMLYIIPADMLRKVD